MIQKSYAKYMQEDAKPRPVVHVERPNVFEWDGGEVIPAGEYIDFEEVRPGSTQLQAPAVRYAPPALDLPADPHIQIQIDWDELTIKAIRGGLGLLEAIGRLTWAILKALIWILKAVGWMLLALTSIRPAASSVPFDDCGRPKKVTEIEYLKIKITEQ